VRGLWRVQLREDGRIVGDSGWIKNQVTNLGVSYYLCDLLGQSANSLQVSRMCLGSGAAPASNATALPSELGTATYTRTTVTYANVGSFTARFTATWASANSHNSGALADVSLSNIAVINATTSGGTILAGTTYSASNWATNQDVNATYEIQFSTA
jgi:hypothetical protein